MPSFCMVVKCGSNAARDAPLIRFFRIPSIFTSGRKVSKLLQLRRKKWIAAIKRDDLTESKLKYGRVCSLHFHSGKPASLFDQDNPDWVPTKCMGHTTSLQVKSTVRFERLKDRDTKTKQKPINPPDDEDTNNVEESMDVDVPAEITHEQLQFGLRKANEEIYMLREELKKYKLDQDYFKNNDSNTLYYTGFPEYAYLKNVYKVVEPYLSGQGSLTKFQQLVLGLMKLRLNLAFTDLGNRFQCHRTTAARTFERVVEILYCRLKCIIQWPNREDIQMNMPSSFKNVFNLRTTVIIDCFEVFIEKPSNLEAAAKTWSHYKHHHTMKFLIGITPQGVIMFISNAYGGRASDKFITETCGFLDKLMKGDLVVADRGFTIEDSVKIYCAEVQCPAFLKSRKQLNALEVESTRKLASVRIHIERVIGLLKLKFKILHEVFPLVALKKGDDDFAFIDKIVVVCSALLNLCPGIVPLE